MYFTLQNQYKNAFKSASHSTSKKVRVTPKHPERELGINAFIKVIVQRSESIPSLLKGEHQ